MKLSFLRLAVSVTFLLFISLSLTWAGVPDSIPQVKNIILMVPDGTSVSTYSLARWYQRFLDPSCLHLALDELQCGTVITYSSDAPIGDSAPTTSCYMTGMPSQTSFIASYPVATEHDLVKVDPDWARRPMPTLAEVGKWERGKRIGLVMTVEFPHATPADCVAHSYRRSRYDWIVPQMVHMPVDVLLGGGHMYMSDCYEEDLRREGITYIEDDLEKLREYEGVSVWALFGERDMPYELDRGEDVPSLAELTRHALRILDRPDDEGFFLLVEGSKVDWAAHANDPAAMATEMLAFDRAVAVALDFAKRDGETAIVILSDHGNSGMSIGRQDLKSYDKASAEQLFAPLAGIKRSARALANMLNEAPVEEAQRLFRQWAGFELLEPELQALYHCTDYRHSPIPMEQRRGHEGGGVLYSSSLVTTVASIYRNHTYIGFTTYGHTGEEVLLGVYHPAGGRPFGVLQNYELHHYLRKLWGIDRPLLSRIDEFFAPHTEIFAAYKTYFIGEKDEIPQYLVVELSRERELHLYPFSRRVAVGSKRDFKKGRAKEIMLPNNSVWVEPNHTLYLNRNILSFVK